MRERIRLSYSLMGFFFIMLMKIIKVMWGSQTSAAELRITVITQCHIWKAERVGGFFHLFVWLSPYRTLHRQSQKTTHRHHLQSCLPLLNVFLNLVLTFRWETSPKYYSRGECRKHAERHADSCFRFSFPPEFFLYIQLKMLLNSKVVPYASF